MCTGKVIIMSELMVKEMKMKKDTYHYIFWVCRRIILQRTRYFSSTFLSSWSDAYFHISSTLTPIAHSKMVFLYYPRIRAKFTTGDNVECLYCAIAFITFLSNTFYTVLSIRNLLCRNRPAITACLIYHDSCSFPSDPNVYKDEVLTVLAVYIIIPIAVFAELLVSVLAVKNSLHDQRSLRDGHLVSSFFCSVFMCLLFGIFW